MRLSPQNAFVIDASVVLKWFSEAQEVDLEKALKIRDDFAARKIDLIAPELLIYEVANVLRYKKALTDELVIKAINSIYDMDILTPMNLQIMKKALRLARKYGITVYDSTYVGFAQYAGCHMITADDLLLKKMGDFMGILSLREYEL